MGDELAEDEGALVGQYSAESRERLAAATAQLTRELEQCVAEASAMRGGSSEMPALFAANDRLGAAARAWETAYADHTGTFPLPLADDDEDEEDADRDDDRGEEDEPQSWISLVGRWDLEIEDADELLAAGRAAHLRLWPNESEEDARVAVQSAADALYTIGHEAGEPWQEVPGVWVAGAARVYVATDGPPERTWEPPMEDKQAAVGLPPGRVVRGESWV